MDGSTSVGKAFSILKMASEEELQNFIIDIEAVVRKFTKLSLVDRAYVNNVGFGHTPEDSGSENNEATAESESTTSSSTSIASPGSIVPPETATNDETTARSGIPSAPLASPAPDTNDGVADEGSVPDTSSTWDRAAERGDLDVSKRDLENQRPKTLSRLEDAPEDVQKLISSVRKVRDDILAHMGRPIHDSVVGNRHWVMEDKRILDIEFADGRRDKSPQGQFRRVLATLSLTQQFLAWECPRAHLLRPQRSARTFATQHQFHKRRTVENSIARGRKLLNVANRAGLPSISVVSAFTWSSYRNINENNIPSFLVHLESQEPALYQTLREKMQWFTQCQELYECNSQSGMQHSSNPFQGLQTLNILSGTAISDATGNTDESNNSQIGNLSELRVQREEQTARPASAHGMLPQHNDQANDLPETTDYNGALQSLNNQDVTEAFEQSYATKYSAGTINIGSAGHNPLLQSQRDTAVESSICYLNDDTDLWDMWQPGFSAIEI